MDAPTGGLQSMFVKKGVMESSLTSSSFMQKLLKQLIYEITLAPQFAGCPGSGARPR